MIAAVLAPLLVLDPGSHAGVVWPLVIEVAAVAVLVLSASRMPAGARLVWWGLAASQALTLVGDLLYAYQGSYLGQVPFPGWADPFYFASYLAEIGALVVLTRHRHPARDREQVLDAAIMTLPIAAVVGAFVILPMLSSDQPLLTTVAALAYPVLDLVMLAGLIRLLVGGGRPNRALALVTASVSVVLGADLIYNGLAAQAWSRTRPAGCRRCSPWPSCSWRLRRRRPTRDAWPTLRATSSSCCRAPGSSRWGSARSRCPCCSPAGSASTSAPG